MKYLILLSLLSGCGMHVSVDKVQSDPVQVVHTFNINFDAVRTYCAQQCVLAYAEDLTLCTNSCYANFLQVLMAGMTGSPQ